jgi:hypothetical protein
VNLKGINKVFKFQKYIREKFLLVPFMREFVFFLFGKKVYKKIIDKRINKLISKRRNLSNKKINKLIVSLTSFPDRIEEVQYTIFSLLEQTVLPEKIVLWLAEEQFPEKEGELPEVLLNLRKFGLEIKWCEDIKSYKKLIPALDFYPEYFILTADDDIYYGKKWLEGMWNCHLKYSSSIICWKAKRIVFDKNGISPYAKWPYANKFNPDSRINFPIGAAGVLYHKNLLFSDVTNKELFLSLAPHADDVWFYFMAIFNNTAIRLVLKPRYKKRFVNPYREYDLNNQLKLTTINVDNGANDEQMRNIINYYKIDIDSFFDIENIFESS